MNLDDVKIVYSDNIYDPMKTKKDPFFLDFLPKGRMYSVALSSDSRLEVKEGLNKDDLVNYLKEELTKDGSREVYFSFHKELKTGVFNGESPQVQIA